MPDARAPLRDVVEQIQSGRPAKTGTERLFRLFPDLLRDLPLDLLHRLFGAGHFEPWRIGTLLTAPIFLSRGRREEKPAGEQEEGGVPTADYHRQRSEGVAQNRTTRTDLHCEPIANVAIQILGRKKWTLVDPQHSFMLRPAHSPDGRAYVYASIDPADPAIGAVPRFEVEVQPGDLLYLPTWWWHRVDYLPGELSFTASLFHFRVDRFIANNPLYAAVIVPNLVKELMGWNVQ